MMQIVFGSRKLTHISFRKMVTHKGNFIIRMLFTEDGQNSSLLFYINAKGERFISPAELKNTPLNIETPLPYLHYTAWNIAKQNWTVPKKYYHQSLLLQSERGLPPENLIPVKEERLTDKETECALKVAEAILQDPLHGFPEDVVTKIRQKLQKKEVKGQAAPAIGLNTKNLNELKKIADKLPA